MQCGVEEKIIWRQEVAAVKCFKCGEEGHKYRECPLWKQIKKAARVAMSQKVQQERRLVRPIREKVQEGEKKLRGVEEGEAAHVAKPQEVQQGWKKNLVEELRKRAEEHCGKGVPEETQLWDLGWCTREIVVSYLTCKCREKGSHVKDNRGQGVIPFWKWKELSWYGCKGKTEREVV